jgi:hypothetical protein
LYPETENCTKTFVLCYGKWKNPLFQLPGMSAIARKWLLQATTKVVEQDLATLESLYSQQKPKMRLPNEEIMIYAEKLYKSGNRRCQGKLAWTSGGW